MNKKTSIKKYTKSSLYRLYKKGLTSDYQLNDTPTYEIKKKSLEIHRNTVHTEYISYNRSDISQSKYLCRFQFQPKRYDSRQVDEIDRNNHTSITYSYHRRHKNHIESTGNESSICLLLAITHDRTTQ